jgi:N,N'-diacetylchitobiose transport system substrate-binding protein
MKKHIIVALCFCAVGAAAVTAAFGATTRAAAGGSITVWLQVDAQTGWPDVVAAANQQFATAHPGWTVNVQYQSWSDHLQKLDAALAAGGGGPDVVEMGNTEMTKYMAAGAFDNLASYKSTFDNSANWLSGLAQSGTYGGKLFGVPYYAGSRVVTFRTDLFRKAGIRRLPTSLAQFTADAARLAATNGTTQGFSPIYIAGTDWYVAMSFVYDYGGSIARTHAGKWWGNLTSPRAIAGLTAYKNFFDAVSQASKTADETHPNPYDVYAQGGAASMVGPSWFSAPSLLGKYAPVTAQFVMPSHLPGQPMPGFLGGSDLAVPVTSSNEALAADWIKDFTNTQSEKALEAKGNIPNATNLLGSSVNERAAARSWFVPQATHWVDVENANVLRNMLAQILTGSLTVKQAAIAASANITSILNET